MLLAMHHQGFSPIVFEQQRVGETGIVPRTKLPSSSFLIEHCQSTTPNRLRGEARNGRRAIYVDRSRRPDGDLRDKPGCVPASGCTKGAPWRISRCIGPDGSPVGGAQQRRLSPYLVSQEEKPSKSARGAGPPGTRKARRAVPLHNRN